MKQALFGIPLLVTSCTSELPSLKYTPKYAAGDCVVMERYVGLEEYANAIYRIEKVANAGEPRYVSRAYYPDLGAYSAGVDLDYAESLDRITVHTKCPEVKE